MLIEFKKRTGCSINSIVPLTSPLVVFYLCLFLFLLFVCLFLFLALEQIERANSYRLISKTQNLYKIIYCNQLSVQFSSVAQSRLTLCDPMNRSTPGLPVHHQLPEFTQTHVHQVSDAIQPSHPLSSPSPPAPNSSQHQSLFQ